jgi:hypothetical protein
MQELIPLLVDAAQALGSVADVAKVLDEDPTHIYAWMAANGLPSHARQLELIERLRRALREKA